MTTSMPTKTIWVTKEGQRIHVRDMSDSHLVNTVKMLLQCAKAFREDVEWSSDGDCDYSDPMLEMSPGELASELCPTFDTMKDEMDRRGLLL